MDAGHVFQITSLLIKGRKTIAAKVMTSSECFVKLLVWSRRDAATNRASFGANYYFENSRSDLEMSNLLIVYDTIKPELGIRPGPAA